MKMTSSAPVGTVPPLASIAARFTSVGDARRRVLYIGRGTCDPERELARSGAVIFSLRATYEEASRVSAAGFTTYVGLPGHIPYQDQYFHDVVMLDGLVREMGLLPEVLRVLVEGGAVHGLKETLEGEESNLISVADVLGTPGFEEGPTKRKRDARDSNVWTALRHRAPAPAGATGSRSRP
ncbi:hypothetical protein F6X40_35545 [Paraburkholderia sp. UCT31]|uniref:hypothetical protein n=1 Tax=Paraburkholderia sp. UCT31 TaxID=2615209 RepID=UPI0016555F5E|nr:hypothetical protein [Paraburkholderia sp. UCT31]MBC8741865.1 hypothetical protein [Paraburkholderia sp. UCT31]